MSDLAPRQNVKFDRNGTTISGYLQLPPSGSGPGLVVIQEWWGLDDHMVAMVDRFAAEGFVALAPDLLQYQYVGELYEKIRQGFEAVEEAELFIGPSTAQVEDTWSVRLDLRPVVDRASALAAGSRS